MKSSAVDLSILIPLYNERESIRELASEITESLGKLSISYEIIFVDDGSRDGSFEEIKTLASTDSRIIGIRFRRNYGKSAALSEGFEISRGNIVVTMDADLQDDPAELPAMIEKLNEGYDVISGWKKNRKDPLTKKIPSRLFNFVTRLMSGVRIHDFNCGLKIYKADVVKTVRVYGELHRYIPVLAKWAGFRVGELVVNHRSRKYGSTKFGASRFFKGFLDLLTVMFLGKYNKNPLHFFGILGGILFFIGLLINGYLTYQWFGGIWIGNRPILFLGILMMIVGIQFVSLGLLAEMIAAGKDRENYSVSEKIGVDSEN
ncbi:MAG: glycosyltransferase family 2 protein [Candidatus Marinimicrobia bacterium]|nr:glycosyltransferase family 2 protein [Candidatus Neomarinimicrobiota bacterium]